ncbi:MAG: Rieske 2Fe-2S domain-containing protein [Myxococcaceae bacterium]|jgi:phenylpropionate dioxygenase-like ring-hydroxylating dioxygenase large terminal subunit|nr:Rieske 2Fe-2S domain-containing protein [Myxococcaceae bacterium]MCA3012607.1 Rieske 2Fe-2S domain-containing protein [Myxococcaceae bacterium]
MRLLQSGPMSAAPPPGLTLPDAWFVACRSQALGRRPLAVTLQDKPLVLFRGRGGAPAAFTDRCPHRNVPLSAGDVVAGELQCRYHGWRFSGDGQCVAVPGLVDGEVSLRSRCAETWACVEQQGFVWVYSTPDVVPSSAPFSFPHLGERPWGTVVREFEVEASVHAVVENTLDVPHTAFLHRGLFRTAQKSNVIDVVVRRHATWAEAEFIGEPAPKGLIGRLLAPGGGVTVHFDRFLLPSIAQVEYRLGERSHLYATSALTPVHDTCTRVFAVVTFKLPLPAWVVKPFVAPVASAIFAQDAVVLRQQTEQLRRFGGARYTSTELDVLGPQVTRLLKQAALAEETPAEVHEHRLRMKT